jgi:intracellular multiplication protein IcmO
MTHHHHSRKRAGGPDPFPHIEQQIHNLGHTAALIAGSAVGAAAVTFGLTYLVCRATRLRWSWAPLLAPVPAAAAAVFAPVALAGLAGAAFGGFVAAGALAAAERRDELQGGQRRRRSRARRGPVESLRAALERRALRRGPLAAIDIAQRRDWPFRPWRRRSARIAIGISRRSGRPVWLRLSQIAKHVLVLGATGSGKTTTMLWIATRMIRAGYGAVVVDLKGDPKLWARLAFEAGMNGRPFYLWRIQGGPGTQRYNPLGSGDVTSCRDRLVASQAFAEDYYRGLFATHAKVVLDALTAAGIAPTLGAVARWWNPSDLELLIRRLDDGQRSGHSTASGTAEDGLERAADGLAPARSVAEAVKDYVETLPKTQFDHILSLRARLSAVTDTAAAESLEPGTSEADEITLAPAMRRKAVVCFSLDADAYPVAAATLASLILQDLVATAGAFRQAQELAETLLWIDEFGAVAGEQGGRLVSTARDVAIPILLGGQDLAQLRRVSEQFEVEVKANVSVVIAHRQSEPDSAEMIARMCGTEEVVTQTQQVDRRELNWLAGSSRDETGVGSRHHERQFRVDPDEVKDLGTGAAVVRGYNPTGVDVVDMFFSETPEELAAYVTVDEKGGATRPAAVADIAAHAAGLRAALGFAGQSAPAPDAGD